MTLLVHQAWFNNVPILVRQCLATWENAEGVDRRLYGLEDAERILGPDLVRTCMTMPMTISGKGSQVWRNRMRLLSDLLRYKLIGEEGGLWADGDTSVLRHPVRDLLQLGEDEFVLFSPKAREVKGSFINGLLYASGRARQSVLDMYERSRQIVTSLGHIRDAIGNVTGPHAMRRWPEVKRRDRVIEWPMVAKPLAATDDTVITVKFGRHGWPDDVVPGPKGWDPNA
ncbi:MAG: hypothetical protein D6746_08530 [Bacteroidetes bacterium]|nr:MAG: hypothetical protein D6746_08530 [Bacteroidota bacterium]